MIHLQIAADFQAESLDGLLKRAAQIAVENQAAATEAELTVVLADDARLRGLNNQYLGIDAPTDVLAFPSGEEEIASGVFPLDPVSGAPYLGDVVISWEQARRQAEAGGHSLEEELQLLVVHGVLHLLGHDHTEEEDKSRMWAAQDEILSRLEVALRPEP